MQSSLILNDLTCIDYAYIDSSGLLLGGSLHPTVIITGEVTDDENVVLDFSKSKKLIKSFIDDKLTGFDHKLWVLYDSKANIKVTNTNIIITTGAVTIDLDKNALRVLRCPYKLEDVSEEISEYLEIKLSEEMEQTVNIKVLLSHEIHALNNGTRSARFSYAHGLKHSSSYGCQNIAHGHLSYLQALGVEYSNHFTNKYGTNCTADVENYIRLISYDLDKTYFVYSDNLVHNSDSMCVAEYLSLARGTFKIQLDKTKMKVRVLETETTIEHLINYVIGIHGERLKSLGVKYLVVSEGLTKGSIVSI